MRPVSHRVFLALPALLALLLLCIFAAPLTFSGITLTPNIAWLFSLTLTAFYPTAWPRGVAFGFGLLQDVVFATPLGSQALLTLALVSLMQAQAQRHHYQLFRVRWIEAAGTLIVWHGLLWLLLDFAAAQPPALVPLLMSGVVSAAWYPLFYFALLRLCDKLPVVK